MEHERASRTFTQAMARSERTRKLFRAVKIRAQQHGIVRQSVFVQIRICKQFDEMNETKMELEKFLHLIGSDDACTPSKIGNYQNHSFGTQFHQKMQ